MNFFIFKICLANNLYTHNYIRCFKVLYCSCFFVFCWRFDQLERVKSDRYVWFTFKTRLAPDLSNNNHIRWYFKVCVVVVFSFFLTLWWAWVLYSKYVLHMIYTIRIIFDVFKVLLCSSFFYVFVDALMSLKGWKGHRWMFYIQNTSCTRFEHTWSYSVILCCSCFVLFLLTLGRAWKCEERQRWIFYI